MCLRLDVNGPILRAMKKIAVSLICTFCAAAALTAAPTNSVPVPADAAWFAQFNADQMRQTQLWQALLKELDQPAMQNRLQALKNFLNFDPRKDLSQLSVSGKSLKPADLAIVAQGGLDTDLLQTMVSSVKEHDTTLYQDRVIHTLPDRRRTTPDGEPARNYGCVPTNGTVIFSQSREAIEGVLDVMAGRAKSLSAAELFGGLGATPEKAFLVIGLRQFDAPRIPAQAASILKHLSALRICLAEEGADLVLEAHMLAKDEASAQNLRDLLLGLKAGVAMQERPEVAIKLAQAVTVKQDGARVTASLKVASEEAIQLIRGAVARRMNRAR